MRPLPEAAARLARALAGPLPGRPAQDLMLPGIRRLERFEHERWRKAAVLVLLYPGESGLRFLLTRRREDLPHHPGQVSFPGGSLEEGEGVEEAALREAAEEVGLDPERVEVLGRLSPLKVPPSGFEIDPVVAWAGARPAFRASPEEVAELIEADLAELGRPEARGLEEWTIRGRTSPIPFFRLGGHKVWGATAMILAEFAEILARLG